MRNAGFFPWAIVSLLTLAGCVGPSDVAREPAPPSVLRSTLDEEPSRNHLERIAIHSENFYPEGIAVSAGGTFYVGSFATGEVVRVPAGAAKPEPFLPANGRSTAGMLLDDERRTLWLCDFDMSGAAPSALEAYDADTGAPRGRYLFPPGGFCNDMALDASGNVYATDSFLGVIRRLPLGGSALEVWATDARFLAPEGVPGLNGIAWNGQGLYVVKYATGELFRVDLGVDGSAGAVTSILTDSPVGFPDGLKALDADSLLVVDNDNGKLKRIDVTGDSGRITLIADKLDNPTTAVVYDGSAYVVEAQLDHLFGMDPKPPKLPFVVTSVRLE